MGRSATLRKLRVQARLEVDSVEQALKTGIVERIKAPLPGLYKTQISRLTAEDMSFCPDWFSPETGYQDEIQIMDDLEPCYEDHSQARISISKDLLKAMKQATVKDLKAFREQRIQAMLIVKATELLERPPKLQEVLSRLLFMSLENKEECPDRSVYVDSSRVEEVREIGQYLLDAGGENLMYFCADLIPRYDQREADFAWHGIGRWRC